VIDGDTFDIGGVRVRLHAVDAPELGQICTDPAGVGWDCGDWARAQVAGMFAGRAADCVALDTDRYGRMVARCSVAGRDIGAGLVDAGVAMAYRAYGWDYDPNETAARLRGVGIWAGAVQEPAQYRAAAQTPEAAAPGDCMIKGNISDSGRIYHLPQNRDYARTRINMAQGERWFCSEAEALSAGWRAVRN